MAASTDPRCLGLGSNTHELPYPAPELVDVIDTPFVELPIVRQLQSVLSVHTIHEPEHCSGTRGRMTPQQLCTLGRAIGKICSIRAICLVAVGLHAGSIDCIVTEFVTFCSDNEGFMTRNDRVGWTPGLRNRVPT